MEAISTFLGTVSEAIASFFGVYGADIGTVLAFLLTVAVLSYVLGDNVVFRLAIHVLIGISACLVTVAVFYAVVVNQFIRFFDTLNKINQPASTVQTSDLFLTILPLALGLWMMFKAMPRLSRWGSPAVAYVVGVGAAVAIGGAVTGTIFPQVTASASMFGPSPRILEGSIILVATVTTLVYFQFSTGPAARAGQRPAWLKILAGVGQFFIAVAFGALFAGAYAAALAALIERLKFIWYFIWEYLLYYFPK